MDFLESLVVMNTAFSGQIPKAIEDLKRLKTLYVSFDSNVFSTNTPWCIPGLINCLSGKKDRELWVDIMSP